MKIFFASPLTNLKNPDKSKAFFTRLDDAAKKLKYETFWAFQNGTDPNVERILSAPEVYRKDTDALQNSDLMIAYITEPSSGVGIEVEYANTHNIPVVVLYEKGVWTSRMLRGCPSVKKEIIYETEDDAVRQLTEYLSSLPR